MHVAGPRILTRRRAMMNSGLSEAAEASPARAQQADRERKIRNRLRQLAASGSA